MPGLLPATAGGRLPGRDVLHIVLCDLALVALAQGSLQHDADRKRQPFEICETCLFKCIQAVNHILLFPNLQNICVR